MNKSIERTKNRRSKMNRFLFFSSTIYSSEKKSTILEIKRTVEVKVKEIQSKIRRNSRLVVERFEKE